MALRYVILTTLSNGPASGYEIKKQFDDVIHFFWDASHQQIYRELKTLLKDGCIQYEVSKQSGRPTKKTYSLTKIGQSHLAKWVAKDSERQIKDEVLVKLLTHPLCSVTQIRKVLDRDEVRTQGKLKLFFSTLESFFPANKLKKFPPSKKLIYLTLMKGIYYYEAQTKWIKLAKKILSEF